LNRKKLIAITAIPCIISALAFILFYPWIPAGTYATHYEFEGIGVNDQTIPYNVIVTAKDEQGNIIHQQTIHNNLTTPGVNEWMRHRLFNSSFTVGAAHYIAIGTGTDNGDPTDNTDLINQIDCKVATPWIPDSMKFGLNATFTFSGSYTITEAGVKTGTGAYPNAYLIFYVNDLNVSVDQSWTLEICWIITIQQG